MTYQNQYAQRIYEILSPLIGEFIARSSIAIHAETLGSDPEQITADHLGPFAKELEHALVVFVGSEKARDVANSISSL